jgi:hypothetical protein
MRRLESAAALSNRLRHAVSGSNCDEDTESAVDCIVTFSSVVTPSPLIGHWNDFTGRELGQ